MQQPAHRQILNLFLTLTVGRFSKFYWFVSVSRLNPGAGGLARGNTTPPFQDKDTMSDLSTPRAAGLVRFVAPAVTGNDEIPIEKLGQR
jgi:hypothetical protein